MLCADQPDIFVQKLLKQTKGYLIQRGQEAAQKLAEGLQDANSKIAAAENDAEGTANRSYDL